MCCVKLLHSQRLVPAPQWSPCCERAGRHASPGRVPACGAAAFLAPAPADPRPPWRSALCPPGLGGEPSPGCLGPAAPPQEGARTGAPSPHDFFLFKTNRSSSPQGALSWSKCCVVAVTLPPCSLLALSCGGPTADLAALHTGSRPGPRAGGRGRCVLFKDQSHLSPRSPEMWRASPAPRAWCGRHPGSRAVPGPPGPRVPGTLSEQSLPQLSGATPATGRLCGVPASAAPTRGHSVVGCAPRDGGCRRRRAGSADSGPGAARQASVGRRGPGALSPGVQPQGRAAHTGCRHAHLLPSEHGTRSCSRLPNCTTFLATLDGTCRRRGHSLLRQPSGVTSSCTA